MQKLLMGNEAIALGAIRAGVQFVSGYPGTPSTEVLETVAKNNKGEIYVEWSTNEKSALEVAAGAAYSGARAMVTMKQVGLNVASDPLMSLNYVGVKGGMVIVVADDPGPISSQTEQDTRAFGEFAKLMVFDPSTPEEAYLMIADAFEYSERFGRPVIFRPTTRVCHGYASVTILEDLPKKKPEGFVKDTSRFVIFPSLTYRNHILIEKQRQEQAELFSNYSQNLVTTHGHSPKIGIVSGGVSYAYTREVLDDSHFADYKLMKISTYPFPEQLAVEFMTELDEVVVIEELDPVIEKALLLITAKHNLKTRIRGKLSGDTAVAGENTVKSVGDVLCKLFGLQNDTPALPEIKLPVRPPVLCAGCPHRSSFYAVKQAAKGRKAVFSGDIGCYTLGNAMPLDMVDTCLCMGAGITIAQGINRVEPDTLNFAFIGDSTFFHTGIPGLINAVFNQSEIIVVILDNFTTAMTGNQTHPGIGKNVMGEPAPKISIYDIVKAIGVDEDKLVRVNVFDYHAAQEAVEQMIDKKGVRVILFEGACIAVAKNKGKYVINEKCTGCGVCVKQIGCPAITIVDKKAVIDKTLCSACGLCETRCAFGAIEYDKEGE